MATTISTQDIVDAKRDIDDIGEAVNEVKIVSPRYGEDFKSLPMIAAEAQGVINEWQDAINTITVNDGIPALAVSDASGKTQQDINNLSAPAYIKAYGETNPVKYGAGDRDYSPNDDAAFAAMLADGKRDIYLPDSIGGSKIEYLTTQEIVLPQNTALYGVGSSNGTSYFRGHGTTIKNTTSNILRVTSGCIVDSVQCEGGGYYANEWTEDPTTIANPSDKIGIVFDGAARGANEVVLNNIYTRGLFKGIDLSSASAPNGSFVFRPVLTNIKTHFNKYGIYQSGTPNQVLQTAKFDGIWCGFNGTGLYLDYAQNVEINLLESEAARDQQHVYLRHVDGFSFANYNFENKSLPADLVGVAHPGNGGSSTAILAVKPFVRLFTCSQGVFGQGRALRFRNAIFSSYSRNMDYGKITTFESSPTTLSNAQYNTTLIIYSDSNSNLYGNHTCTTKPVVPSNESTVGLRGEYTLLNTDGVTVMKGRTRTLLSGSDIKIQNITNNTDSAYSDRFAVTNGNLNARGIPNSADGLSSGDLYRDAATNTIKFVT